MQSKYASNCSNLIDQRFGKLVVESLANGRYFHYLQWNVLCDCGNRIVTNTNRLRRGDKTHCGCVKKSSWQKINLIGQKFGRLTVAEKGGIHKHQRLWICRCDCGKSHGSVTADLRAGKVRSCGCLKLELMRKRAFKHGRSRKGDATYISWQNMKDRCADKSDPHYGARGISVCPQWIDFAKFVADVGDKPSKRYTIERIDPNGNYEPENVIWIDKSLQSGNTRRTRRLTWMGKERTLLVWSEIYGVPMNVLDARLARGVMPPALFDPSPRRFSYDVFSHGGGI